MRPYQYHVKGVPLRTYRGVLAVISYVRLD